MRGAWIAGLWLLVGCAGERNGGSGAETPTLPYARQTDSPCPTLSGEWTVDVTAVVKAGCADSVLESWSFAPSQQMGTATCPLTGTQARSAPNVCQYSYRLDCQSAGGTVREAWTLNADLHLDQAEQELVGEVVHLKAEGSRAREQR